MELEEQERREIIGRQKEYVIRLLAAATGQSAQMFSAMNRRAFNEIHSYLTDDRVDDIDALAQPLVDDQRAEQEDCTVRKSISRVNKLINVWGLIVIWPLERQDCAFLPHQNYLPLFHLNHRKLNLQHGNRNLHHHLRRHFQKHSKILHSGIWTL